MTTSAILSPPGWMETFHPGHGTISYAFDGPRTNNHLEGWHNRIKLISIRAHPHLWELVQKEQASTEVAIEQVAAGRRRRAKRRKVVQHEEQIKRLTDEFRDGDRSLDSLLSSMSHCVVHSGEESLQLGVARFVQPSFQIIHP